jgi:hypothetical protein
MGAVERFCDRAMVLEHGRLVDIGDTERIGTRYLELNFSSEARAAEVEAAHASEQPACDQESEKAEVQGDGPALAVAAWDDGAGPPEAPIQAELPEPEKTRFGNGKAELVDAWFEDANGSRTEVLRGGERCAFCARVTFHEQVDNPLVGVSIYNAIDDHVLGFNNRHLAPAGTFAPGEVLIFRFAFHNALVPGRYHLSPAVAHDGGGVHWLDYRKRWRSVVVTGTGGTTGALVELPLELSLQRLSSAREPHLRSA